MTFDEEKSTAQKMLVRALETSKAEKGMSARELSRQMGYSSTVALSHMASGRMPIPIERAKTLAEHLGMDPGRFLMAVLKDRHPDVDFTLIAAASENETGPDPLWRDLEIIAGKRLSELEPERVELVKQLLSDRDPARRWLTLNELKLVELVRSEVPSFRERGIPESTFYAISTALISAGEDDTDLPTAIF